jgi:hypothetical protein
MESFNGEFRDECLNLNWFMNVGHAREVVEAYRLDYTGLPVANAAWSDVRDCGEKQSISGRSPVERSLSSPQSYQGLCPWVSIVFGTKDGGPRPLGGQL